MERAEPARSNGATRMAPPNQHPQHYPSAKKKDFNRRILHRTLMFFSPRFNLKTLDRDLEPMLEHIRIYAGEEEYGDEVARALVWRVVDAQRGADLYGSWKLLVSAYEIAEKDQQVEVNLLKKLERYLVPLIRAKWYSDKKSHWLGNPQHRSLDELLLTSERPLDVAKQQLGISTDSGSSMNSSPGVTTNGATLTTAAANDISSAGGGAAAAGGLGAAFPHEDAVLLVSKFSALEKDWLSRLNRTTASELRRVIRSVASDGNTAADERNRSWLVIPEYYLDSLAVMRRKYPRPSTICNILDANGWNYEYHRDESNPDGIPKLGHIASMLRYHPVQLNWIAKMCERGCCVKCDTWKHDAVHCPCAAYVRRRTLRLNPPIPAGAAPPGPTQKRPPPPSGLSFGDAVQKLRRYDIPFPLDESVALDVVVQLIQKELPFDDVVEAVDVVRGACATQDELHALWIHASYNLLPSATVFASRVAATSGDGGSANGDTQCMRKARRYLHDAHRFREFDRIADAVNLIDRVYRRHLLPEAVSDSIEYFLSHPDEAFLFCFFERGFDSSRFPVEEYAADLTHLRTVEPYVLSLCRHCLGWYHKAEQCPRKERFPQPWDYSVAQAILQKYDLHDKKSDDAMAGLGQALADLGQSTNAADEADDAAARHADTGEEAAAAGSGSAERRRKQKNLLELAAHLILESKVNFCSLCKVYGHGRGRCEAHLRSVLKNKLNLSETEVRLRPQLLDRAIERSAEDERLKRQLEDAKSTFCSARNVYPPAYQRAIDALTDARIELAAARYSPEAATQFILYTQRDHLVEHLRVVQESKFPDVCLYCSSVSHSSTECDRSPVDGEEERSFLLELQAKGIRLVDFAWAHLCPTKYREKQQREDGHRYVAGCESEDTATNYPLGKATLIRRLERDFIEAYQVNGRWREGWDRLQEAITTLQQHNLPLNVAFYCPFMATEFVQRHHLPHLVRAIRTVHRSKALRVCIFCSSLTHRSHECDDRNNTKFAQHYLRLLDENKSLKNFVLTVLHDREGSIISSNWPQPEVSDFGMSLMPLEPSDPRRGFPEDPNEWTDEQRDEEDRYRAALRQYDDDHEDRNQLIKFLLNRLIREYERDDYMDRQWEDAAAKRRTVDDNAAAPSLTSAPPGVHGITQQYGGSFSQVVEVASNLDGREDNDEARSGRNSRRRSREPSEGDRTDDDGGPSRSRSRRSDTPPRSNHGDGYGGENADGGGGIEYDDLIGTTADTAEE